MYSLSKINLFPWWIPDIICWALSKKKITILWTCPPLSYIVMSIRNIGIFVLPYFGDSDKIMVLKFSQACKQPDKISLWPFQFFFTLLCMHFMFIVNVETEFIRLRRASIFIKISLNLSTKIDEDYTWETMIENVNDSLKFTSWYFCRR